MVGIGSPMRTVTCPRWKVAECMARISRVPEIAQRNHGDTGFDGDIGRAVLERLQYAVVGAASLRENKNGDVARSDAISRKRHGFHGRARIFARNRDVPGLPQMRAEEGNLEQPVLRHKPEVSGNVGEDDGRIHIAEMVGGEDVSWRRG